MPHRSVGRLRSVARQLLDVADGLWLWRLPHPDWRPGLEWEP
ncbi:MAG: hypothetical protein V7644_1473, partial [Actinomycetota bacterium]